MKTARAIVVVGDVAFVPLTQGKRAIIDSCDVPLVKGRNWSATRRPNRMWYAVRYTKRHGRTIVRMHRLIVQPPDDMEIDHVDHDGLNNRRTNLRVCTRSQNMANGRYAKMSSSQFRGVSWHRDSSKWIAAIRNNGPKVYLGLFENEVEAARAYDDAATELHGEFASPNFPRSQAVVCDLGE